MTESSPAIRYDSYDAVMSAQPLVTMTEHGLHCPAGDFYIDPWRPVERAVTTHAHSDHARAGSKKYLAADDSLGVLRVRLGEEATIETVAYGKTIDLGEVSVSLHPAGHLLGSAQVRIERGGEVWVISGDYKTQHDQTCQPFEPVECDCFITECTFGLPIYHWRPQQEIFDEINQWWRENQDAGRTSVIYAYALGKAHRVLAGVDESIGPILVHGAVAKLVEPYRAAGIELPALEKADAANAKRERGRALVVAVPSAAGSPWLRKFGEVSSGIVSGWMQIRGPRRRRFVDRGFVLSDHADWNGLHDAIKATGAQRIGLTHGYTHVMARHLSEQGCETDIYPTRYEGELEADDTEENQET